MILELDILFSCDVRLIRGPVEVSSKVECIGLVSQGGFVVVRLSD